jgi:predicted dehydrogenase
MTAAGRIRWGVLGTAGIVDRVVPAMQQCRLGTVTAIASRAEERATTTAQRLGVPTSYGSYEELLADPAVDAVYVPLPNFLHREWVLAAIAAGKHVLCEKPMALTAADAHEMRAAADAAGVRLAEAFMYGHHPRYDRIEQILASGEIGPVRSITATFTFDASDEMDATAFAGHPGGGAVYDVGCYLTHVGRRLLHREPDAVTTSAQWSARHGDIDMLTAGLVEFGDVPLLLQCGMWAADKDWVEILGTAGRIEVPSAFFCAPGQEGFDVRVGDESRHEVVPAPDHYTLQADDLAATVLHGVPPRYPPGDAAANAAVLEACLRSARSRRRVAIQVTAS